MPPQLASWRLCLLLLLAVAVPTLAEEEPTRVSLQLPWKHQFEFAGFYAAIEQGFYRDRGLEVELREYHAGLDLLATVRSGEATFGLTHGQVISWRLQGEPVVLLANYFRKPPLVLLTRAGLHRLTELRGTRLMAAPDDLQSPLLRAAFRDAGLVPGENLTIVSHSFDASPLIRGDVEAMTAFLTNDPFDLESKGVGFQVIELGGYLPGLGDSYLFTSEEQTHARPEITRAFVEASNAGWAYALAHPDELVELIHTRYAPTRSRAALAYEAGRTRELMQTRLFPVGAVLPAHIELAAAALLETDHAGEISRLDGFVLPITHAEPLADRAGPFQPADAVPALSEEQRAWLQQHPVLRYTLWNDRAPVEYVDAAGQPSGISTDYLAAVARYLGLELQFVPTANWNEAMARIRAGEIDLLPSAAPSAARADVLAFTRTYLDLPIAIFALRDAPFYGSLDALSGQRVAVIGGTVTEDWLRRDHPELQLLTLPNIEAGLRALERGEAVALVDSLLTFSHVIGRDGAPRLRVAGATPYRISLAMAARRDLAPLAELLDLALAAIPASEREAIEQRWMQRPSQARIDYRLLWQVLGVAALIVAMILYWNRRLARAQAALARSETYYRGLIATMAEGVLVHGRDGLIRTCNAAAARLLGQPEEALVGQALGWRLRREDGSELPEEQQPALVSLRTGTALRNLSLGLIDARGEARWILLNSEPLVLAPGQEPDAVLVTFADVTNRVRIEQSLRDSQARYDEIVRRIPVGIYTISQIAGQPETLDYLSPRAAEILDLSVTEAGWPSIEALFELVAPEDRARLVHAQKVNFREDFFWEGRIQVRGATRWCRLESVAVPQNEDVCIWQGVLTDITAQKEVEAAMIRARQEAEAANRAKSDFLANMSHEIRTPMNSVLGMMYLCLETELTATQRDYLDQAHRAARALLVLLNDILDLSKVEAGHLTLEQTPFALSTVLNDLNSVISRQAQDKGLALRIVRDPALPDALLGDAVRLRQLLINLANNAIKFTEQGSVEVVVKQQGAVSEATVWLIFTVRDSGIGMDQQQLAKLFQPFQQGDSSTTRRYGGTGLGLSICKHLVELMQGSIEVSSQLGQGSLFTVKLPFTLVSSAHSHDATVCSSTHSLAHLSGRRVLVVEDNPANCAIIRAILERIGMVVTIAEHGQAALEKIETSGLESWDLILMDIQMPILDGLQTTQRIRARADGAKMPIIGLSANARAEDTAESLAAGMNAHLAKPIDPPRLFQELAQWLTPPAASDDHPATETPPPALLSPEERTILAEQLDALHRLATICDTELEDQFKACRPQLESALPAEDIAAIAHLIERYRFNEVAAKLERLRGDL